MRAPLRAVSGFAQLVTKKYSDKIDDEGKDALKIINSEASRMGQLIDDLLAFSRLGKNEIQKFKTDMNNVAQSAMKEVLNSEKSESKPEITFDNLPEANCDSVLMRQVFINLFSNAVKYSAHVKQPVIHVGAYTEPRRNVYYVKDNGAGFDMKFYHKLFGVFQRLHTQPEFKGTGIGLAIVQRIINRHGGTIWADAKLNEGATFYFSLPK
jgi:light-regulated signal transduction histidine kinase (bacteriophytochrome)